MKTLLEATALCGRLARDMRVPTCHESMTRRANALALTSTGSCSYMG